MELKMLKNDASAISHSIRIIKRFKMDEKLKSFDDVRFKKSGFKKCIQCGRCTASCPAAYLYYDYNPRQLMKKFMFGDIDSSDINELIWKCGQCYSCRARCPRNCKAGLGVQALQTRSLLLGIAPLEIVDLSKQIKKNLMSHGEAFLPSTQNIKLLEAFGEQTYRKCSENNLKRERLGFKSTDSRRVPIPEDSLQEIREILKLTGFVEDKPNE